MKVLPLIGLAGVLVTAAPPPMAAGPGDTPVCDSGTAGGESAAQDGAQRRRPGTDARGRDTAACDPTRMPTPDTSKLRAPVAAPDRWRLLDLMGRPVNLLDPYDASNPLKGDRPIYGSDVFFSLAGTSNSQFEARTLPAGTFTDTSGALRSRMAASQLMSQTISLDASVYQGDTIFRPPDWAIRFNPVFINNVTHNGDGTSSLGSFGIQNFFAEKHLWDVSSHYDFDSVRVGIQPLTSDFRGFLLLDQPLALRLFGTRDSNRIQYNLAIFDRLAKSSAKLNDMSQSLPNDPGVLANVYIQDLPVPGATSELLVSHVRNRNAGTREILGISANDAAQTTAHDYDVSYAGYSIDGHLGRLNLTGSAYDLWGTEQQGTFTGTPTRVQAQFLAAEVSVDFDWWRPRLSALHASGDRNPYDDRATGFDVISSSSIFAGSDSSDFIHQSLALPGGAFSLKARDSLLPSLRGADQPGQSNFTNPGLNLVGVGADFNISPQWTVNGDLNQLWFDRTAVLRSLLNNPAIGSSLGTELSLNGIWRPFDTQNLIVRATASVLHTGDGLQPIHGSRWPYSTFVLVIFNW